MDPLMTDADVAWLRQQTPFASLSEDAFPRSMPLSGILKNDCRLHRVAPGQVIVREGDYANSAFLVLAGRVELMTRSLPAKDLGRDAIEPVSWSGALWQFLRPSPVAEARSPDQVAPRGNWKSNGGGDSGQPDPASPPAGPLPSPVLFLQDFDGIVRAGHTVPLGPGELFGEVAAMYRSPRGATVVAAAESALLEIRWQGLKLLRRDRTFADRMEAHYRATWLPLHLREVPLLRYLPEANLRRVVQAVQIRSFGRMQWNADYAKTRERSPAEQIAEEPVVAREGHQVTDLILVRSGFGRVCQSHGVGQRTTAYLGKGHLFGLDEIAHNAIHRNAGPPMPLQRSLLAVGFLDTLHIPVECFAQEILPHVRRSELPDDAARDILLTESANPAGRERRRPERARGSTNLPVVSPSRQADDPDDVVVLPPAAATWEDLPSPTGTQFQPTGLLEFIVQNRFNNGAQAMVIDLHRCTRCDDCVKACAATHDGNPRFARIGPQHERLQFVQACMQCTDPVCMIGCPTGAIHRDETTGVVRIAEPICIGCGTCANACPYDNIDMVEILSRDGRPFTDEASGRPIQKATKCDMCAGSPSGPACQSACPHDALVRIDLSESPPLEDWLRRRT